MERQAKLPAMAAVVLLAAVAIGPGLGRAALWEPDEPRFAEATRQMFARGDFLTPYFNGVPRFEKPILFYWLQAAAVSVLGANELAMRVPAALAGIGAVSLLYLIGVRVASERAAIAAALVFATMFRFVVYARQGLTDVPVLFFIVAALYGFMRATDVRPPPMAVWLAWAAVGLGVLTKGPVGFLSLIIWGAYAASRRDVTLVSRIRPVIGLCLAVAIALPWYLAMMAMHGRAFVDFALGHEIVARVVSEESFAPTRGFFYYWKVWPGDAAPWSVLFVAAAAWALVRWRRLDAQTRQATTFALAWFVAVFVTFSVSRSKVPHYVLPAYPAAALLIGVFVDRVANTISEAWWWRLPMALVAVVIFAASALLAWSGGVVMPEAQAATRALVPMLLAAGGAALLAAIWKKQLMSATVTLAVLLAAIFAVIGAIIVPGTIERSKPMPYLAREAAQLMPDDGVLGLLGRYGASSLIYYSGRRVQFLDDDESTIAFLASRPGAVCVLPATDLARLTPRLPPTVRTVAIAEEFNVRFERLLERQRTPGRQWVVVAAGGTEAALER